MPLETLFEFALPLRWKMVLVLLTRIVGLESIAAAEPPVQAPGAGHGELIVELRDVSPLQVAQ